MPGPIEQDLADPSPESKSDSLARFGESGVTPPTSHGLNRFHGQKNRPSGDVQQSGNGGQTPFPPRAVGIPRSFNSRAMALMETMPAFRSLRIVGRRASARRSATRLLVSSLLVPPRCDISRSRRVSIRVTAVRCHLPPPAAVQFIRQPTLGNEARHHKLPNGREQSKGAGVCGPLIGQRTMHLAPAGRRFPALSLHWAIVAGPCRAQPGLRLCRGREGEKRP